MFKRPPSSIKATTPIRSSTLRKLRASLPSSSSSSSASIFPDGSTQTKVLTHLDQPVLLYSAPASDGGDPIAFHVEGEVEGEELIPTVYTLQRLRYLPEIVTASAVVPHLVSGSALFITGVSTASLAALDDKLPAGALVAIVADGDVVAVGRLDASVAELRKRKEGKAVNTLHAKGDFLWKMRKQGSDSTVDTADDEQQVTKEEEAPPIGKLSLADEEPKSTAAAPLTPDQISQFLLNAFLLALRTSPPTLPQPASSLYASHVLPFRPADQVVPEMEVKKSGYKKVAALFKHASKMGVVTIKEKKDEVTITAFDSNHPATQAVKSYKTVSQAASSSTSTSTPSASKSSHSMTFTELYKPPPTLQFLFASPLPIPPLFPYSTLKSTLTSYIAENKLTNPNDGKYCKVDENLARGLKADEAWVKKDELLNEIRERCEEWYQIDDLKPKKGRPPEISIVIKPVGNRTATIISGHEAWGIEDEKMSEELKKRAASSASVMDSKTGKKGKEILLQGSHEKLVKGLIEEMGVPKKVVVVEDKTKAKKK